jgi:hypothetical protein
MVEGELGHHVPSERSQFGQDEFDDLGVAAVDQSIDHSPVPAKFEIDQDAEGLTDTSEAPNRHIREPSALHERHNLLIDNRRLAQHRSGGGGAAGGRPGRPGQRGRHSSAYRGRARFARTYRRRQNSW